MHTQVLVLNSDFQPINVTTLRRGFILVQKGKADVVAADTDNPIRSTVADYIRPLIIRLKYFVPFKKTKAKLTRYTIFARDGDLCQYDDCTATTDLTIDHIHPKSRGGRNTWSNMITACRSCNTRKDDKTPKEAKMVLKSVPIEPSNNDYLIACNVTIREAWEKLMTPQSYT